MTREATELDSEELPLSVVIVTYNEEKRVRQCIESVFDACRGVVAFEVILVDSNSTDRTVDYATDYPITVLRITDDDHTTPGAGRYVGTKAARGEAILFVDGDMILETGWLESALELLGDDEEVVAVDGHLNGSTSQASPESPDSHQDSDSPQPVDAVWGVALYDADSLREVGGFHPYLESLEDIYLGYRLTAEGKELRRLPATTASHPDPEPFSEPFRRWRQGYMKGPGQVVRLSMGSTGVTSKLLYRLRHRFLVFGWLCLGLVSVGTLSVPAIVGWLALSILATGFVAAKLGMLGAGNFVVNKLVGVAGFFHGFARPPDPPGTFPMDVVEQIQWGPVHYEPVRQFEQPTG